MKLILKLIKYLAIFVISIFIVFEIGGLIIKDHGQSKISNEYLNTIGAELAVTKDGRRIEYFKYGTNDRNAPVVINIHGSGLEGGFERDIYGRSCEYLGVRGLSITLPGFGNTDMKIGRKVIDWSKEDLAAVLEKENIDKFMITGHSQGNPHAMAAAYYYKDRVIGLGLNAPLLPIKVTKEEGLVGAVGIEDLPTTDELRNPLMGWYFSTLYIGTNLLAPDFTTNLLLDTPELQEDTLLRSYLTETFIRTTVRGSAGNVWESAVDVCYEWGFDPRKIDVKNICVWHATDDEWCPPAIGAFLADYFKKKGAHVNFKNKSKNGGHMTYCTAHYREPKNSLLNALLEGRKEVLKLED